MAFGSRPRPRIQPKQVVCHSVRFGASTLRALCGARGRGDRCCESLAVCLALPRPNGAMGDRLGLFAAQSAHEPVRTPLATRFAAHLATAAWPVLADAGGERLVVGAGGLHPDCAAAHGPAATARLAGLGRHLVGLVAAAAPVAREPRTGQHAVLTIRRPLRVPARCGGRRARWRGRSPGRR